MFAPEGMNPSWEGNFTEKCIKMRGPFLVSPLNINQQNHDQ